MTFGDELFTNAAPRLPCAFERVRELLFGNLAGGNENPAESQRVGGGCMTRLIALKLDNNLALRERQITQPDQNIAELLARLCLLGQRMFDLLGDQTARIDKQLAETLTRASSKSQHFPAVRQARAQSRNCIQLVCFNNT